MYVFFFVYSLQTRWMVWEKNTPPILTVRNNTDFMLYQKTTDFRNFRKGHELWFEINFMYTINAKAEGLWQINLRPKHLLYLDSTQKSYASQFWPSSCSFCILANVKWQHIFTHDIVSSMSKLQKLESTPYTPMHDTRSPDACESIAFHFWYRHACVVMYSAFRQKFPKLWTSAAHSFLEQIAQNKNWAHPKVTTLAPIYKVEA